MEKQIITFSANEQKLIKTGGIECYASNIVSYIEAHFDLGANWSGYDSVRAVWSNDNNMTVISTVLDSNGVCVVPFEVLKTKGIVKVNLVGSISVSDVLTDRLTTFPCEAVKVTAKAKIEGSETQPITPSQFEQFVAAVISEVEKVTGMTAQAETLPAGSQATARYENGILYLGIPQGIQGERGETGADGNGIASVVYNADYSLTLIFDNGERFTTPPIRGERGPAGADGRDGTDGRDGADGVTPSLSVGTVTTLPSTEDAYVTRTGTDENPVFDFGIPQGPKGDKGDTGEVSQAEFDEAVSDLKSDFSEITEVITTEGFDTDDNLLEGLTLSSGYYANGSNTVYSNSNFSYLGIDITGISKLKINGTHHIYTVTQFPSMGVFLDSENTWVANVRGQAVDLSSFPIVVNVPSGATKLYLNTDYKASNYPSTLPSGLYVYPWKTNVEAIKVPYSALEKEPVALADLSQGDKKLKIIAGVIRNSGNGWEYINNSGHEPLNLTSISVDSYGRIKIDYGFTASKVLSLVATPDETFAGQYAIGGSVGLENSLFNVYSIPRVYGGMVRVTNGVVDATSYATFTSAEIKTTGEIRLYHPSLLGVAPSKEVFNIQASSPSYEIKLGSQGFDYVSLYVYANGQKITDFTGLSFDIYAMRNVNALFINANNIVDAGGNFWIYGVMEI